MDKKHDVTLPADAPVFMAIFRHLWTTSDPGVDRTWKNQTDLPGWWFGTFFIFPFSWE